MIKSNKQSKYGEINGNEDIWYDGLNVRVNVIELYFFNINFITIF